MLSIGFYTLFRKILCTLTTVGAKTIDVRCSLLTYTQDKVYIYISAGIL
jgi:hypothetical protein